MKIKIQIASMALQVPEAWVTLPGTDLSVTSVLCHLGKVSPVCCWHRLCICFSPGFLSLLDLSSCSAKSLLKARPAWLAGEKGFGVEADDALWDFPSSASPL